MSSCANEEVQTEMQKTNSEFVLKSSVTVKVISDKNLAILKEESLKEFQSLNLSSLYTPNFDLSKANEILSKYSDKDLQTLDFELALGGNYDKTYFEDLDKLMNFTVKMYKSNLFEADSSLHLREEIVGVVLDYVIDESYVARSGGCTKNYNICVRQAARSHSLRMGQVTAGAGLGMALAGWTGVGAAASAGGWVIGMIGSGLQYEIDIEACRDFYC